jgi:pimeloyl-ACP methyl ester carboxylesterase
MKRLTVEVDGVPASYLTAGNGGSALLLLHGTYWSRIWQPILEDLAAAGLRPIAVDFPGFGRSGGELSVEDASVPALADWTIRFLQALNVTGPVAIAGHDIGGGVAQHLLVDGKINVSKLALVNAANFDTWPVPGVKRFQDPTVPAEPSDILAARRVSLLTALARPTTEEEIAEYLHPWTEPRVARSWLSLARAADHRYTMNLVPALQASKTPIRLVWGEVDTFQVIENAERIVREIPRCELIRIPSGGHMPMENDAKAVATALTEFFA